MSVPYSFMVFTFFPLALSLLASFFVLIFLYAYIPQIGNKLIINITIEMAFFYFLFFVIKF